MNKRNYFSSAPQCSLFTNVVLRLVILWCWGKTLFGIILRTQGGIMLKKINQGLQFCMAFIMAFITAQNTLSTFLTFWHLFHVQGVKFPSHVSRRKIYDVNLVLASLRRKIYQRLFYGEKSIILQCTLKVVPSLLKVFKYITTWLYLAWHVTT